MLCDIVRSLINDTLSYWENPDPLTVNDAWQLENELSRMEKKIMKNHKSPC